MDFPLIVEHKNIILKLFNWMDYPEGKAARNVEAYDINGVKLWTIGSLGGNPGTDCYTSIESIDGEIHAFNFQGYDCMINETNGRVISALFTK